MQVGRLAGVEQMLRKMMMACVAAAAIATVAIPTDASARWYGHGGWRGGWHGGYGYRGWGYRPYAYYPYAYGAYAYGGCYRTVRVFTPWGPRWRRVWVC
jgi:hypothetical protein